MRERRRRRRLWLPLLLTRGGARALRVAGNKLVTERGSEVVLVGVTWTWATCDPALTMQEAYEMRDWGHNVIRIEFDEGCWVADQGGYREAIRGTVDVVLETEMYAIIVLQSRGPFPNEANSLNLWRSLARDFKDENDVIFELFDEPEATWNCWRTGDCDDFDFPAAGMGRLVEDIRAQGARNVLLLGGIDQANDLTRWLEYKPDDPLNNVAAAMHTYSSSSCSNEICWENTLVPILENFPVVVTETAIGDPDFAPAFWGWLEHHNASYLVWAWGTAVGAKEPQLYGDDGSLIAFEEEDQYMTTVFSDENHESPIVTEFGKPAPSEWANAWYDWLHQRRRRPPPIWGSPEDDLPRDQPDVGPDVSVSALELLSRSVRSILVIIELILGATALSYVIAHCRRNGTPPRGPSTNGSNDTTTTPSQTSSLKLNYRMASLNLKDSDDYDDESRMPLQDWLELEEDDRIIVGGDDKDN